jgi:hypothetical protein
VSQRERDGEKRRQSLAARAKHAPDPINRTARVVRFMLKVVIMFIERRAAQVQKNLRNSPNAFRLLNCLNLNINGFILIFFAYKNLLNTNLINPVWQTIFWKFF